eukprot:109825-Alexandrium_andersonii.AAC.1
MERYQLRGRHLSDLLRPAGLGPPLSPGSVLSRGELEALYRSDLRAQLRDLAHATRRGEWG